MLRELENNSTLDLDLEYFHSNGVSDKGASDKLIGVSDKGVSDKGSSDKSIGESDKGASDKSTSAGYKDNRNANYLRKVYLLHILIVAPIFLLGCFGLNLKIFGTNLLKIIGWILLIFMGYSLLKSEITGNWNWNLSKLFDFNMKQDRNNATRLRIVYIFHIIIIVPLLLLINYSKKIQKQLQGALCILGIMALIYHGYSYWRSETSGQWNWDF